MPLMAQDNCEKQVKCTKISKNDQDLSVNESSSNVIALFLN